jgi:hypothetical protein
MSSDALMPRRTIEAVCPRPAAEGLRKSTSSGLRPGLRPVEAEVPLAEHGGGVALAAQEAGQREPARLDQARTVALQHAALQPAAPGVAPGEQRVAGRRADARGRMRVGEHHPSRARRSRCGVCQMAFGLRCDTSPMPMSSARMKRTLGAAAGAAAAQAAARAARIDQLRRRVLDMERIRRGMEGCSGRGLLTAPARHSVPAGLRRAGSRRDPKSAARRCARPFRPRRRPRGSCGFAAP